LIDSQILKDLVLNANSSCLFFRGDCGSSPQWRNDEGDSLWRGGQHLTKRTAFDEEDSLWRRGQHLTKRTVFLIQFWLKRRIAITTLFTFSIIIYNY